MSHVKDEYAFQVEGVDYPSGDAELTGRQVRSISGHDPAADFRLIQIHDRYTSSVGLEDPVKLEKGEKPIFRIFEGDRDYDFTVEDRGWEWGAPTISERDVRLYGKIAEDRDVLVDGVGKSEVVVGRGGMIDLEQSGIERVYSRKVHARQTLHLTFVTNGVPTRIEGKPTDTLSELLAEALEESENTGQPVEAWQVTDEPGNLLDVSKTLAELGIKDGAVLLASLKTGAAG